MPEAGVEQMQGGMLHSAVVPVNRHPVIQGLLAGKGLVVAGIRIAQEIPGGSGPLRHSVGLSLCRAAAVRAGGVYPVRHCRKRRLAVVRGHIALHLGKL